MLTSSLSVPLKDRIETINTMVSKLLCQTVIQTNLCSLLMQGPPRGNPSALTALPVHESMYPLLKILDN